jgi:hypothetical protein
MTNAFNPVSKRVIFQKLRIIGGNILEFILCQKHEEPQKQRFKKMLKFNFQTKIKTRLCDSKIKTQE